MTYNEKNVLFGNGVNIEFSGTDEYKNYSIIQRMCDNMNEKGRYTDVFNGTIDADDMRDFLLLLHKWFKEHALKGIEALRIVENKDELLALMDMSKRYSKTDSDMLNIGLEDYLLALKLFNATYKDEAVDFESLYQGITKIMLDSIYNDGKIEEIYKNMECLKTELLLFSNIFTVNYDTNIEHVVGHKIYHLHGSFDRLHHEYSPQTLKGWAIQTQGKKLPRYIKGKEYLYCDAIFGFSGQDKQKRIDDYNYIYEKPELETLRNQHPELECPRYPIKEFMNISGELHIIGLGPNNDSHIFKMINENNKINKVIYYSASEEDSVKIKKIVNKKIKIKNVFEYWDSLKENQNGRK